MALNNTSTTGTVSVGSLSIAWKGLSTTYTPSGACDFGPSTHGSWAGLVRFLAFPPTSKMTPSAIDGQNYTATVTLSSGAKLQFTGTWQGPLEYNQPNVWQTDSALRATDFSAGGTTKTFSCATTPSLSYFTLANIGPVTGSVANITISWAGGITTYTPSGACDVSPTVSATSDTYIDFPATTTISPSAIAGQNYTGTVTLTSGAKNRLLGWWQGPAMVAVTGTALRALTFIANGERTTYGCGPSTLHSYITLTNTGPGTDSVTAVSFSWGGTNTTYTVAGACEVGGVGSASAITNVYFSTTNRLSPSAIAGQNFAGTLTMSSGAKIPFAGTWKGGPAQLAATRQALQAADFVAGGSSTTFTCATSPSSSYLALTNTGSDSATVVSIAIGDYAYTLSGTCNIGPSGSTTGTTYLVFPSTSTIKPSAIRGQTYWGIVYFSNGVQTLPFSFDGTWG
ncbi:MAG TPA: hypothetical protein VEO75_01540 [Nitrososphaerales archaeon]|nr:hypothetical protein [Nitrososphaerales archaeon]